MFPKVSIIILNWNGWKDTIECLESLYQINYPNYDVILVDNNSNDTSLEKIKDYCKGNLKLNSSFFEYAAENKPIQIIECTNAEIESKLDKDMNLSSNRKLTLIKNDKNYGFAEGNNIGMRYAYENLKPDYIFLLNNDTVVHNDFLIKLVNVAEHNKNVKILGSKVFFYNYNGQTDVISTVGGKINWKKYPGYYHICEVPENHSNEVIETDWVTGAALMIKVGNTGPTFLNSSFLFGCEDVDLCILSKNQGYHILTVLNSVIWHKVGVSRNKRYSDLVRGVIVDTKTNFKFIKTHNRYYFLYLPLYIIQMMIIHLVNLLKLLSRTN